jgi:hypothetical protein
MKLNTITEGSWTQIANYLNYNFNKLSVATSRLGEIRLVSFKGVYTSNTELRTLQTDITPGDYAFVLEGEDMLKVFYVDLNYDWVTDGGVYDPKVILSDYIEMTALNNISQIDEDIEDYNNKKKAEKWKKN